MIESSPGSDQFTVIVPFGELAAAVNMRSLPSVPVDEPPGVVNPDGFAGGPVDAVAGSLGPPTLLPRVARNWTMRRSVPVTVIVLLAILQAL